MIQSSPSTIEANAMHIMAIFVVTEKQKHAWDEAQVTFGLVAMDGVYPVCCLLCMVEPNVCCCLHS